MKFFFTAIIFAFGDGVISDGCVEIRGSYYEKQVLKSNVAKPYQLAIDHHTNTLFYSYTARAAQDMFKSAYLNLNTGNFGTVYGIKGGFAQAVNNNNYIVYMGGEDGLYKFDYNTMTATSLHIKENINIWQMFYKDGLYFTTFPEERAYFFKNYQVVALHALENVKAMMIAADINNNIVYFNSSGVFMYERGKGKTVFISDAVANGVTSDRYGNIVFSTLNGIYYVSVTLRVAHRVSNIDNIYGIAVEKDGNMIYAAKSSIIRLRMANKKCQLFQQRKQSKTLTPTTVTTTATPKIIEINIGE